MKTIKESEEALQYIDYKIKRGERIKMKFKCCFEKCKYKNESLLNVFKHMQIKHELEIGKNIFKLKEKEDSKKIKIYCKNPECFNHYLADHKIKEIKE